MRKFISMVSANKGKTLMGLGSGAIIGYLGYLYNQNPNLSIKQPMLQLEVKEVKTSVKPLDFKQPLNFKQECAKFKKTIDIYDPSLEEVKKMIAFSLNIKKKEIEKVHKEIIAQRLLFKKSGNLKEYFNAAKAGQNKLRQTYSKLLFTVLSEIGITDQAIESYSNDFPAILREQRQKFSFGQEASLDFMKSMRKKQNQHLKKYGNQFVSHFVQQCKNWEIQTKKKIPDLFMIYLMDELVTVDQQIKKYDIKDADKMFEKQLKRQNTILNYQVQNLVTKLVNQLGIPLNPQNQ